MGVFQGFLMVQMVPNRAVHHIYAGLSCEISGNYEKTNFCCDK